jgi:hypothetical protein
MHISPVHALSCLTSTNRARISNFGDSDVLDRQQRTSPSQLFSGARRNYCLLCKPALDHPHQAQLDRTRPHRLLRRDNLSVSPSWRRRRKAPMQCAGIRRTAIADQKTGVTDAGQSVMPPRRHLESTKHRLLWEDARTPLCRLSAAEYRLMLIRAHSLNSSPSGDPARERPHWRKDSRRGCCA